jgi:hypothetical protein
VLDVSNKPATRPSYSCQIYSATASVSRHRLSSPSSSQATTPAKPNNGSGDPAIYATSVLSGKGLSVCVVVLFSVSAPYSLCA